MRSARWLGGAAAVVLGIANVAVLGGCRSAEGAAETRAPAAAAPTAVFSPGARKLESVLRVPGEMVSFERVDLYAKVSSFVRSVNADVGSEVAQGQLLAVLDAPEIGAQLAEAESALQAQHAQHLASKANYDRLLEASKTRGTVSQNDLEQAEAREKGDRAKLEAARAAKQAVASMRGYLELRAPFAGVVSARNVSPGAYVGPSGRGSELPLYTVQQQHRLRLVVSVPEAYVGSLQPGSEVTFTLKSRPGEKLTAKVARIAGALDARLRSERVEIDIDNTDKRFLPGMVAEVSLPLVSAREQLVVPRSALLESTTGTFVVRAADGKAQWVPVQRGREVQGEVEVFGDVKADDVLVRKVSEELRDGTALGPLDANPPPS